MADKQQERIISLQARLKIANDALTKIAHGGRDPEGTASQALYDQMSHEPKRQLQDLVQGHFR